MHTKVVSCASKNPLKSKSKEMKTLGSSNEGEDVLGQCSSNLSLNAKWGDSTFLALRATLESSESSSLDGAPQFRSHAA
jgi:hypothetical protein